MSLKIQSVSLHNFRGVESLRLAFAEPGVPPPEVVVLAGPNGCGKTSLIEACLLALGKEPLLGQRGKGRANVQAGKDAFSVTVALSSGVTVDATAGAQNAIVRRYGPVPHGLPLPDGVSPATLEAGYKASFDTLSAAYFSSWREPLLVGPVAITAGKKGKRPAPTEENRLWRLKNFVVNLQARRAFAPGEANQEREQAVLGKLNAAWKHFYPHDDHRFEALAASEKVEEGFDLFLVRDRGARRVPVDCLSSGEVEVLTFLGTFLIEDLHDGLLFVDEPELHLHPGWHHLVLKALRTLLPTTQIICSTHSPHILNQVPARNVWLLRRENDQVTAVQPQDAYGLEANRVLEDLMGAPARPQEVAEKLRGLYQLIDLGRLPEAKAVLADLQREVQADPAFSKATMLILRKEVLGK